MHRVRWIILSLFILTAVSGIAQQNGASAVTVNINVSSGYGTSISFDTASTNLNQGGLVTWINQSDVTVSIGSSEANFQSSIQPRGSFTFTFQSVGAYVVNASYSSAQAAMTVSVLAQETQEDLEPLQQLALIHSLGGLEIFPGTVVVRKDIKVRIFNIGLESFDLHGPIVIRDRETGNPAFEVSGNFTAGPGAVTTAEFTPDRVGEFDITHELHGHPINGTLIVVESYPDVLATLLELGQLELSLIHSLSDLEIFPKEAVAYAELPIRVFNTAKDGFHDPVFFIDPVSQQPIPLVVDGAADLNRFQVAPNQLTTIEFERVDPGELIVSHESHGHPITSRIVLIVED